MRDMILRVVFGAAGLAGLLALAACGEVSGPPQGICWVAVDSLYASGVPADGEAAIQTAFADYVTHVESTEATFPENVTQVAYVSSRYYWKWEGVRYWQIHYRAYDSAYDRWFDRELVYIDENGVLVTARGCI